MPVKVRRVVERHADQRRQGLLGSSPGQDDAMTSGAGGGTVTGAVDRCENAAKRPAVGMCGDGRHFDGKGIKVQMCRASSARCFGVLTPPLRAGLISFARFARSRVNE